MQVQWLGGDGRQMLIVVDNKVGRVGLTCEFRQSKPLEQAQKALDNAMELFHSHVTANAKPGEPKRHKKGAKSKWTVEKPALFDPDRRMTKAEIRAQVKKGFKFEMRLERASNLPPDKPTSSLTPEAVREMGDAIQRIVFAIVIPDPKISY